MVPHSISIKEGPGQSPSLWEKPGAIGRRNRMTKNLEGMTSMTTHFYDRGPDLGSIRHTIPFVDGLSSGSRHITHYRKLSSPLGAGTRF
jgi:hypothetical protein